jgi:muconolactone delta-isomerase
LKLAAAKQLHHLISDLPCVNAMHIESTCSLIWSTHPSPSKKKTLKHAAAKQLHQLISDLPCVNAMHIECTSLAI